MPLINPTEQTVFSQTVILSDAQFRGLPSTPIEIVPAPGSGKLLRWLNSWLVLDNRAGVYVGVDAGAFLQLVYMVSPFVRETSGFVRIAAAANNAADIHYSPIPPLASYDSNEGYLYWSPSGAGSAIENVGIGIADIYNGVSDYVGGNAANTLKVTVLYTIIDV